MGLDIRMPIGLMFSALGVMLTLFGLFSKRAIYEVSLGININFIWGLVLLAFGILMLLLSRFEHVRTLRRRPSDRSAPAPHQGH